MGDKLYYLEEMKRYFSVYTYGHARIVFQVSGIDEGDQRLDISRIAIIHYNDQDTGDLIRNIILHLIARHPNLSPNNTRFTHNQRNQTIHITFNIVEPLVSALEELYHQEQEDEEQDEEQENDK